MIALAILGAALAWLGASLTALSQGRRGLALGLALTGAGLALAVLTTQALGALLLAVSAVVAALLRLRDGAAGWGVLPAGSAPGIVLSVAVLVASLLLAGTVFGGFAATVAALAVSAVSAVRLLSGGSRQEALATGSALALGLGALGGSGDVVAGGLVAVALAAIPAAEAEGVVG